MEVDRVNGDNYIQCTWCGQILSECSEHSCMVEEKYMVDNSEYEKLKAENKRLRDALEQIAEDWKDGGWNGLNVTIAYEALKGE